MVVPLTVAEEIVGLDPLKAKVQVEQVIPEYTESEILIAPLTLVRQVRLVGVTDFTAQLPVPTETTVADENPFPVRVIKPPFGVAVVVADVNVRATLTLLIVLGVNRANPRFGI
jgi:hypothetical protein